MDLLMNISIYPEISLIANKYQYLEINTIMFMN